MAPIQSWLTRFFCKTNNGRQRKTNCGTIENSSILYKRNKQTNASCKTFCHVWMTWMTWNLWPVPVWKLITLTITGEIQFHFKRFFYWKCIKKKVKSFRFYTEFGESSCAHNGKHFNLKHKRRCTIYINNDELIAQTNSLHCQ